MLPLFFAAFYIKGSTLFCFIFNDHIWEASFEAGTVTPRYQQDVRMCSLYMAKTRQSLPNGLCIVSGLLQFTDLVRPVCELKT